MSPNPLSSSQSDSLDAGRGNERNRPCRTCTDFKTWAKIQAQTYKGDPMKIISSTEQSSSYATGLKKRPDCPLDKSELGHAAWSFLHTVAAYYPDNPSKEQQSHMRNFITSFSHIYPCDYCAKDFQEQITDHPPKLDTQQNLSQWFCKLHNMVNEKLGKPVFDCSKVDQRWRDGWLDGSCD